MTRIAEDLQEEIEGMDAVLEAVIAGNRKEMMEVVIDPLRLEAYNVTAGELISVVRNNNQLIAEMLGGYMAGVTVSGVLWAVFQNNAGGAWDNAKKSFEAGVEINGEMTYKGSDAHKAAVTGDTVGDPFKDTSGPSMNILIKLTCLIGLVIAPILGSGHAAGGAEATACCDKAKTEQCCAKDAAACHADSTKACCDKKAEDCHAGAEKKACCKGEVKSSCTDSTDHK